MTHSSSITCEAHDAQSLGAGVRYGARIDDLLDRHPGLHHAMTDLGLNIPAHRHLTLEEAAAVIGMPRENIVLGLAGVLVGSAKPCGGQCGSCGQRGSESAVEVKS